MKVSMAIAACALVAVTGAWAQNYPTRPVIMIVPYPPGGLTDAVARPLAEGMQGPLGQTVVIENVGGASGSIGSARVARAAPDGHTLLLGIWNTHVAIPKLLKLDYDVVKDFAPIAYMTDAPLLLTVHKSVPVDDLQGAGGLAQGQPGQGLFGQRRHRQSAPPARRAGAKADEDALSDGPLSRRRSDHAGPPGRTDSDGIPQSRHCRAARALGRDQGAWA